MQADRRDPVGHPARDRRRARPARRRAAHARGDRAGGGGDRVVRAAAVLGPRRPVAGAAPGLPGRGAGADRGDPAVHRGPERVRLLHARHRAARRAAVRLGGRGAVLADADRRLLLGARDALRGRRHPLELPDDGRPARALRGRRGRRGGGAADVRPPGRGRGEDGRDGAPGGRGGRALAARPRHARLARQDRLRDRVRGARARPADRSRPRRARRTRRAGSPTTPGWRPSRRAS